MGQQTSSGSSSKQCLEEARISAERRLGTLAINGRYHRLPKRIGDHYVIEKKVLGTGLNGAVHSALCRHSAEKYAVKSFKLRHIPVLDEFRNEVEILLSLDHTHIVRLVDAYESEDVLHLVMECLEGGDLMDRAFEKERFSEKEAAHAIWQMLLAVNYLHAHGIVHRDIKLENWRYERKDSDWLKLLDFGLSKFWEGNTPMTESLGTLTYIAPEVLMEDYGSQCDLWSIGVIAFTLILGYMPFSNSDKIKEGAFLYKKEIWESSPAKGRDFTMALLQVDPDQRLTAAQALEHPWIKSLNSDATDKLDEHVVQSLCSFAQQSRLKRAAFSVMAWSMSRDDILDVRDAFLALDKGKRGAITLTDLKEVMEDHFKVDSDQVKDVFKALAADDKEIRYSEFLAAMAAGRLEVHASLLRETFCRFDKDNSGHISTKNLQELLGDPYSSVSSIKELLAEAGLRTKGQISWEDFNQYLSSAGEEVKEKEEEDNDNKEKEVHEEQEEFDEESRSENLAVAPDEVQKSPNERFFDPQQLQLALRGPDWIDLCVGWFRQVIEAMLQVSLPLHESGLRAAQASSSKPRIQPAAASPSKTPPLPTAPSLAESSPSCSS